MDQVSEVSEGFPWVKLQLSSLLASCALRMFLALCGLIKDYDLGGLCILSKLIIIPSSPWQQSGRQQIVAEPAAKMLLMPRVQSPWQGGYHAAAQPFLHCLTWPPPCTRPGGMRGLQPHDHSWKVLPWMLGEQGETGSCWPCVSCPEPGQVARRALHWSPSCRWCDLPCVCLLFLLKQDMIWPSKSHQSVFRTVAKNWPWNGVFQLLLSSAPWGWWHGCSKGPAAEGEQTLWTTRRTLKLPTDLGRWDFTCIPNQEGPNTASPSQDKSTVHHCSLVSQVPFQQDIGFMVNTSSCWLLYWDYACVYVSCWMGVLMHYGENIKEIGLKVWKTHYYIWPDRKYKESVYLTLFFQAINRSYNVITYTWAVKYNNDHFFH